MHEGDEVGARNVDLRNHFGAGSCRSELAVQFDVVVVDVFRQLVRIGPVQLPVRRQVIIGVARESFGAICVSEAQQVKPVVVAQPFFCLHRLFVRRRLVTGKHTHPQEVRRFLIDRKLKIAVEKLVRDAFFKSFG